MKLNDHPTKIRGLAALTPGPIMQSISTVVVAIVIGIVFFWKVGLVATACVPVLLSVGYIRLVRHFMITSSTLRRLLIACHCLKGPSEQAGP